MKYSPEYEDFKQDAKKLAKASRNVSKSGAKLGRKLTKQGGKEVANLSEKAYTRAKEYRSKLQAETRKKLLIALAAGGIASGGSIAYQTLSPKAERQPNKIEQQTTQKQSKENTEQDSYHLLANKKFGTRILQSKPEGIHLLKRKQHDKLILKYFPQDMGTIWKVMRCLRRKKLTDAAEQKYGIPSNLLLAMMAQEGMGDPTLPNILNWKTDEKTGKRRITKSDWGLWLIHIQGVNAQDYGLKVLQTTPGKPNSRNMKDIELGKKAVMLYEKTQDTYTLAQHDERWNPVLAVDVAARFLRNCYETHGMNKWKDGWIFALNKYSGRSRDDYAAKVISYWTLLDQYEHGDKTQIPTFSKAINHLVNGHLSNPERLKTLKDSINSVQVEINGEAGNYNTYIDYFNKELDQYGFQAYKAHSPKIWENK